MALKKAVKSESKLRMAIVGPAGSGKTYTALKLAIGLADGKPIALFDTEHGSATKYADDFVFDVDSIVSPFHPDKFCQAIRDAARGGYGVVIIDSLSHAWNGPGGLLDLVEGFAVKTKNSFTAWKDATPIQDRLIQAIVSADIHIIVTMRSKTDYVISADKNGKQAPSKVGMAPIQRDGMDYEFDVVMQMDPQNNTGMITKTRCSALNEGIFPKPGNEVASILAKWLNGAPAQRVAQPEQPIAQHRNAQAPEPPPTDAELDAEPPMLFDDQAQAKSPAFKRFQAEGSKTFGRDWDNARHWLIERYTRKMTPDQVRRSGNDLSDDECDVLADTLAERRGYYQSEWKRAASVAVAA